MTTNGLCGHTGEISSRNPYPAGWPGVVAVPGETPVPVIATPMTVFASGATRSKDADGVRFDLISPIGLRRLAETYREGAEKYEPHQWEKGIPASDLMNHALRHLNLWRAGDQSEDHLAHAAWGLFAVMHFEESMPDMIDVPSRTPAPRGDTNGR